MKAHRHIILLTSTEAARRLGISRQGLAKRVKARKIKPASFVVSQQQLFEATEVERCRNRWPVQK